MTADPQDTPSPRWLVRAVGELDPPPEDVDRLTRSVIASARRLSHSRTALATDDEAIAVTDLVVRQLVMAALRADTAREVREVSVRAADGVGIALRIGITCRYTDRLDELADAARVSAQAVLVDTLGPGRGGEIARHIDVHIADLDVPPADGPGFAAEQN